MVYTPHLVWDWHDRCPKNTFTLKWQIPPAASVFMMTAKREQGDLKSERVHPLSLLSAFPVGSQRWGIMLSASYLPQGEVKANLHQSWWLTTKNNHCWVKMKTDFDGMAHVSSKISSETHFSKLFMIKRKVSKEKSCWFGLTKDYTLSQTLDIMI